MHQVAKGSKIKTCHVSHVTKASSVSNNKIINIEQKSVNKKKQMAKETLDGTFVWEHNYTFICNKSMHYYHSNLCEC